MKGEKTVQEPCTKSSYLNFANDWQVKVDLGDITITNLTPDMILVSEKKHTLTRYD